MTDITAMRGAGWEMWRGEAYDWLLNADSDSVDAGARRAGCLARIEAVF